MKLLKMRVLLTMGLVCVAGTAQGNWVTLDFPGAASTSAYDIDGDSVVGEYIEIEDYVSLSAHGFLYDGTTWTTIPSSEGMYSAFGIGGDKIVGTRYHTWYGPGGCGEPPCPMIPEAGFVYGGATPP